MKIQKKMQYIKNIDFDKHCDVWILVETKFIVKFIIQFSIVIFGKYHFA